MRAVVRAGDCFDGWRYVIVKLVIVNLRDPVVSAVGRQLSPEDDQRMREEDAGLAGRSQRCYRTTKWLYYLH